jgi:hypothetical protein
VAIRLEGGQGKANRAPNLGPNKLGYLLTSPEQQDQDVTGASECQPRENRLHVRTP